MTQIAQELAHASLISLNWQAGAIWFLICANRSRRLPSLGCPSGIACFAALLDPTGLRRDLEQLFLSQKVP